MCMKIFAATADTALREALQQLGQAAGEVELSFTDASGAELMVVEHASAPQLAALDGDGARPLVWICPSVEAITPLRKWLHARRRLPLTVTQEGAAETETAEAHEIYLQLRRLQSLTGSEYVIAMIGDAYPHRDPGEAFAFRRVGADARELHATVSAERFSDVHERVRRGGDPFPSQEIGGISAFLDKEPDLLVYPLVIGAHGRLRAILFADAPAPAGMAELLPLHAGMVAASMAVIRGDRARHEAEFLLDVATHEGGLDRWEIWLQSGIVTLTDNTFGLIRGHSGLNSSSLGDLERFLHPADFNRWSAFLESLRQPHAGCRECEVRIFDREGSWRWIHWRGQSIQDDEQGVPLRIAGVYQDTSGRREAEEAGGRLITAIEQAAESIMITSTDGIIEYVNPAFCHTTGYEVHECIGQPTSMQSSGQHSRQFYQQLWGALNRGEVWSGEFVNRRKSGEIYHEEATISPVRDDHDRIVNFVAVKRDVTSERELEAQLRQAQNMESIGRLAGGVAHDFNNLLMGIMLFADLALRRLDATDPLHRQLTEIRKAGNHATELIRKLMTISRRQALHVGPCDLNEVIGGVASMLERLIGEDVRLICNLDQKLGPITADIEQIRQILLNLVVNARDAMPGGGQIEIATSKVFFDAETARRNALTTVGWYVMISVKDTGHGIPQDVIDHIYEPFFTTKERDRGTGLGLSTVYSIVKQHSGLITVDSRLEIGTMFKVYLPCGEQEAESARKSATEPEFAGGSETILLVEDEPLARHVLVEILTSLGYQIIEAPDGHRALAIAESLEKPVDLLITDVIMPGLSGPRVYSRLCEMWPGLKVLLISGYAHERIRSEVLINGIGPILTKPFSMSSLARIVRCLLDDVPVDGMPGEFFSEE